LALHKGIEQLLAGCGSGSTRGVLKTWATYDQLHTMLQEFQ
jgi:hypothetical protein